MSDEFRPARIARIEHVATDQTILALEHDAVLEAAHTRPGQYCQLGFAAGLGAAATQSYFVIVDPPGAGPLRFLLGAGGPTASALRAVEPGTEIAARGPLGQGFPVEQAHGRDVLLVSAGSALAAIRPVLVSLMPYTARRVWLYHGARTRAHVPFREDLEHARHQGASVTLVLSREAPAPAEVAGRVQDAIARDGPDLGNAVAYVAGMAEMVDSLRELLPRLGLPPERLYLNY